MSKQQLKKLIKDLNISESQLNVWIPKELDKRLEIRGVTEEKTKKEIVINALEKYLDIK